MSLFRVYDKQTMDIIADRLQWEDFIVNYGWRDNYDVVSWDE